MSERQDASIKTKDGKVLVVTVSTEFDLIKLQTEDGRNEIVLDLYDFKLLAKWVEGKR